MIFAIKDVDNKTFLVEDHQLFEQLANQGFKLFGMDIPSIAELRKQYLLRKGKLPITKERIKKIFQEEQQSWTK